MFFLCTFQTAIGFHSFLHVIKNYLQSSNIQTSLMYNYNCITINRNNKSTYSVHFVSSFSHINEWNKIAAWTVWKFRNRSLAVYTHYINISKLSQRTIIVKWSRRPLFGTRLCACAYKCVFAHPKSLLTGQSQQVRGGRKWFFPGRTLSVAPVIICPVPQSISLQDIWFMSETAPRLWFKRVFFTVCYQ